MINNIRDLKQGLIDYFTFEDSYLFKNISSKEYIVKGMFKRAGDDIILSFNANIYNETKCYRCLKDIEYSYDLDYEEVIEEDLTDFNLKKAIMEESILQIPQRVLCEEDCKGLCEYCGNNKNLNSCNCKDKQTNRKFDELLKLKF